MIPDLFTPPDKAHDALKPWRPRPLDHESWPPPYERIYAWRTQTLSAMRADRALTRAAHKYYSTRPAEFIGDWTDTYDPRRPANRWMPFVLFKRQYELIQFFEHLRTSEESGLIEKARDMGATWLACAYCVWRIRYIREDAIGWGSRKADLVHKLGDPDSIMDKIEKMIRRLPVEFRPLVNVSHMKIINNENNSIIAGEAGDNIGRGGRKSLYFKDEAQPLTSNVMTPDGWVRMSDIKVGQVVSHPDGGTSVVTHINDCGVAPTYNVIFSDGTHAECSENHLWKVRSSLNKKYYVKRLSEIINDYIYHSPGGQTQYRWSVPHTSPVTFTERTDVLPLDPYVVGALLGDGSIKQVPKYRPKFTSVDQGIIDEMKRLLPPTCKMVQTKNGKDWRINDIEGRRGEKLSRASQAIMDAGIAGHGAETKFIPDRYKFASVPERLALLQGLMDTDGSASSGAHTFCTCSPQLANDMQFLVQSLGGSASMYRRPDKRGYRDMYVMTISFNDGTMPFRLKRKVEERAHQRRYWGRKILKIEPTGIKPVRCITVDNPDGLYITDNFVVTHNSAHYERPELIEAALGDNTNVQIDISSVNGLGNVFHRRRESGEIWEPGAEIPKGIVRVFVMDWRDHPAKTQEWYDQRKAKAEREGMQHVFAQEVDRNYSAAVENTIIAYEWITAAVDAHLHIPSLAAVARSGEWMAGLDVADEGGDKNAIALRQGVVLRHARDWGERDPGVACRNVLGDLRERGLRGIEIQYDSIGLGSAVKSEYNRLVEAGHVSDEEFILTPWNAGGAVLRPFERVIPGDDNSPLCRDFYGNFKAQAWWAIRSRFYKTWRARTYGDLYDGNELISLCSDIPCLLQLQKELAQVQSVRSASTMKMLVAKRPPGTRSPNLADALVMAYAPAPRQGGEVIVGSYSG